VEVLARGDSVIAVTGGFATVQINGSYVEMWRSHRLHDGDIVQLGFCQRGARLYLAVSGGIQSEPVLQSRSTTVQWGIGGVSGGVLIAGDELPCGSPIDDQIRRLSVPHRHRFEDELQLNVLPCCQYGEFTKEQRRAFFSTVYKVDTRCNRMGYRVLGDALSPSIEGMYSEGLTVGAIQVPPDGQPIVLMRDHQSIGGYPKIATLLSAEIDRLAQCVAGQRLRFVPVCYEQARQHRQRYLEGLDALPRLIDCVEAI
jgi:biotin-dependent carboxylase-like uncharacterized protein